MILRGDFLSAGMQCRSEINQILNGYSIAAVGRRPRRNRLGWRILFAGHVSDFDGLFRNWPDRFPCDAVENVKKALFGGLRNSLNGFSVDSNIRKNWRGRNIHVPERVMNELEMPFALASVQVHAH